MRAALRCPPCPPCPRCCLPCVLPCRVSCPFPAACPVPAACQIRPAACRVSCPVRAAFSVPAACPIRPAACLCPGAGAARTALPAARTAVWAQPFPSLPARGSRLSALKERGREPSFSFFPFILVFPPSSAVSRAPTVLLRLGSQRAPASQARMWQDRGTQMGDGCGSQVPGWKGCFCLASRNL